MQQQQCTVILRDCHNNDACTKAILPVWELQHTPIRFVAGWRTRPMKQALVSLVLIMSAYVSSYLSLLLTFLYFNSAVLRIHLLVPAKRLGGKTRFLHRSSDRVG